MMMTSSESRRHADEALARARRQHADMDGQAPEVAEEAQELQFLLDRNHLAPRLRKAMKLRLRWGQ